MQSSKQFLSKILSIRRNLILTSTKRISHFNKLKSFESSILNKNAFNHQCQASPQICNAVLRRTYSMSPECLMNPRDKVAIVTGAASGAGYSIAKKLLYNGSKVLLVDIDGPAGSNATHVLGEQFGQGNVFFYHGDVACEGHIFAFIRKCYDHFGGVNILINNANVMDASNWARECDINFGAAARGMSIVFDYICHEKGVKGGLILNVCSTYGLKPFPVQPTYCATNRAIIGLAASYSDPFYFRQRSIRMCVLCVGPTCTGKYERGRQNLPKRELQDEFDRVMAYENKQNPDYVGEAVAQMVHGAPHGSIWVVEGGELFMISYPPYKNCHIPETLCKLQ